MGRISHGLVRGHLASSVWQPERNLRIWTHFHHRHTGYIYHISLKGKLELHIITTSSVQFIYHVIEHRFRCSFKLLSAINPPNRQALPFLMEPALISTSKLIDVPPAASPPCEPFSQQRTQIVRKIHHFPCYQQRSASTSTNFYPSALPCPSQPAVDIYHSSSATNPHPPCVLDAKPRKSRASWSPWKIWSPNWQPAHAHSSTPRILEGG